MHWHINTGSKFSEGTDLSSSLYAFSTSSFKGSWENVLLSGAQAPLSIESMHYYVTIITTIISFGQINRVPFIKSLNRQMLMNHNQGVEP